MTATPFLEEILHLVTLFLQKSGHEETAAQLQEHYTLPSWVEHNNPLLKKGLITEPGGAKIPYELYSVGDVSIGSLSAGIRKQEDKERTTLAALIVLVVAPIAIEFVIEAVD